MRFASGFFAPAACGRRGRNALAVLRRLEPHGSRMHATSAANESVLTEGNIHARRSNHTAPATFPARSFDLVCVSGSRRAFRSAAPHRPSRPFQTRPDTQAAEADETRCPCCIAVRMRMRTRMCESYEDEDAGAGSPDAHDLPRISETTAHPNPHALRRPMSVSQKVAADLARKASALGADVSLDVVAVQERGARCGAGAALTRLAQRSAPRRAIPHLLHADTHDVIPMGHDQDGRESLRDFR